jgi:hypothetical protein
MAAAVTAQMKTDADTECRGVGHIAIEFNRAAQLGQAVCSGKGARWQALEHTDKEPR